MVHAGVWRVCWLVAGLVVGAVIVFLVMWFAVERSCDEDCPNAYQEYNSNTTGSRANDTLKLVLVVTRHGNRGGFKDYDLDPYPLNDTDYWPYGASALTPVGRVGVFKLGLKLRSLYNGFLPTTFKSSDIYCDSDMVERVVMSGQLVLAGLYPPEGWQLWNPALHWQPIALYTNSSDRTQDITSCAAYAADKGSAVSAFVTEYADNITAMSSVYYNATGTNATASTLAVFFDKVVSEATEGYTLPNWASSIYPDPITSYYGDYFMASYAGTDTMVRLIIGELYSGILERMENKTKGVLSPDRKMYVFSAHDTTVLSMQLALGVSRDDVIRPVRAGSALIVELHEDSDTSGFYVKVLYIDGASLEEDPTSLSLSSCGDPCTLPALINSTTQFTNVSFEEECASTSSST